MANKQPKALSNKKKSAKQAFKKKQKSATSTKFKNDQLRTSLDLQTRSVYLAQQPKTIPSNVAESQTEPDAVHDLLNSLTNL